jgi:hypothetical protein
LKGIGRAKVFLGPSGYIYAAEQYGDPRRRGYDDQSSENSPQRCFLGEGGSPSS